jgi:heme exporter protein CcmB
MLKAAWAVFALDLALERATLERLLSMVLFSLICAVMFHFTVFANPLTAAPALAGAVWSVFFFAAALGLGRAFVAESEAGAAEALILSPAPLEAVFAGKAASNALLLFLVQGAVWGAFAFFFGAALEASSPWRWLALDALASAAMAPLGLLVASISVQARRREMLFPILFFPLSLPVLMSAAVAAAPGGGDSSFGLLAACGMLYFALGWMLFPHVIKE